MKVILNQNISQMLQKKMINRIKDTAVDTIQNDRYEEKKA